jgi:hypothetical protein
MAKRKVFGTLDIYIVSFLALHGVEATLKVQNGKVVFEFDPTDNLYQILNRYNSNENVPVADFVTSVKTCRGKMLSLKKSFEHPENENGHRNGQYTYPAE